MARHNREAETLKLCILGAALGCGVALPALPANAQDNKLALSASAAVTTDYVFRGISQTDSNPAVQPEFDATYGMFYVGLWGSNLDFVGGTQTGSDAAPLEMDWYGGITPKWQDITFNIGAIGYTYPGSCSSCLGGNLDYVELKTGASYTFFKALTLSLTNYWSPDNFAETGNNDVLEFDWSYGLAKKWFNFFSPSISGVYGHQWGDSNQGGFDYNYWNAGLTLGFLDHWSADVRYWDTDAGTKCGPRDLCDARAVGTLKASF
jgi:uncharacterized protein (TIGR02001 family)